jgi:holliday junction DNA helicase RuvA
MIATLYGIVSEKLAEQIVIDVRGVGYGIHTTAEDNGRLVTGEPAKIYIYEHVREQAHDLFGFLSRDTQILFEQLLAVNGVGPKMALNILSIGTANDVRVSIAGGDVKFIQQASGVGKKVAERVVVELKDKVGLASTDLQSAGLLQSEDSLLTDEAIEALVALGYSPQEASKALQGVDTALSTDERIKMALKAKQ